MLMLMPAARCSFRGAVRSFCAPACRRAAGPFDGAELLRSRIQQQPEARSGAGAAAAVEGMSGREAARR
jgi:hypothetical protein